MVMTNFVVKTAPRGFIPNCETQHLEVEGIILQKFKGGRVILKLYKKDSHCEAFIDNRPVGTFRNLTIQDWSNILYTLQTDFANLIEC